MEALQAVNNGQVDAETWYLIRPQEFDELRTAAAAPKLYKQWGMAELREALLNKAQWWVVQEVLNKYRDELDMENGGFVFYPHTNRTPWRMDAWKMSRWLRDNQQRLDWDARREVQ